VGDTRDLLHRTADHAADFLASLGERAVYPDVSLEELREALGGPLPDGPMAAGEVVDRLVAGADPGVVSIPGGRYFGFVIGGAVPAALAADWLTSTWDQNAGLYAAGPSASVVEEVAGGWVRELLRLPSEASFALVTGCQMANFTALAIARQYVLERSGWNVNADGLAGSPPVRVVCGAKVHVTVTRALRLLGLGAPELVEADDQGRMVVDSLRRALEGLSGPTIVCAQAGEVNTGAFDPLPEIAGVAREAGAWLHVDGAFGLWAVASPALAHLVAGAEAADSWATDAHNRHLLLAPSEGSAGSGRFRPPKRPRHVLSLDANEVESGLRACPRPVRLALAHYAPYSTRAARCSCQGCPPTQSCFRRRRRSRATACPRATGACVEPPRWGLDGELRVPAPP
jgi:hypothetical protein